MTRRSLFAIIGAALAGASKPVRAVAASMPVQWVFPPSTWGKTELPTARGRTVQWYRPRIPSEEEIRNRRVAEFLQAHRGLWRADLIQPMLSVEEVECGLAAIPCKYHLLPLPAPPAARGKDEPPHPAARSWPPA